MLQRLLEQIAEVRAEIEQLKGAHERELAERDQKKKEVLRGADEKMREEYAERRRAMEEKTQATFARLERESQEEMRAIEADAPGENRGAAPEGDRGAPRGLGE